MANHVLCVFAVRQGGLVTPQALKKSLTAFSSTTRHPFSLGSKGKSIVEFTRSPFEIFRTLKHVCALLREGFFEQSYTFNRAMRYLPMNL